MMHVCTLIVDVSVDMGVDSTKQCVLGNSSFDISDEDGERACSASVEYVSASVLV